VEACSEFRRLGFPYCIGVLERESFTEGSA
jgi:hypothetical protein